MTDLFKDLADQLEFFAEIGVTHLDLRPREGGAALAAAATELSPAAVVPATIEAPASGEEKFALLVRIREDLGECTRCKLHSKRHNIVFGVGDPAADLVFVGEAPGEDEDLQGTPFVGKAGQLLTRIIAAIQLDRSQVYIANILKCRPPNNRDPEPDEVAVCEPFLFRQLEVIQPKLIVALGRFAAQTLLRTTTPIGRLRGHYQEWRGVPVMPTFHPSYLLRNPSAKREVWADMQSVRDRLKELGSRYYR